MIPLLIGAGVAALFGAGGMAVAKDTQQEAESTLRSAQSLYDSAKASLQEQQEKTERTLKNLGEKKYSVLVELIPQFVVAFNKFKNVDFRNSVGINELDNLNLEQFSNKDFSDLCKIADTADSLKKGFVAGGAAGAAVALGAGAIAVDVALGAGTVTSIASVAGIGAAADLALAGIGGLVPGLAIVAGPALLIGGFSSYCKADENLQKANAAYAQAETAAQKMSNAEYSCLQIARRGDMFIEVLEGLIPIFRKSIEELNSIAGSKTTIIITRKPPKLFNFFASLFKIHLNDKHITKVVKKNNFNYLSDNEKELLAMSGSLAKAIKSIIDTPILTTDGEVTGESEQVYNETRALPAEYRKLHTALVR